MVESFQFFTTTNVILTKRKIKKQNISLEELKKKVSVGRSKVSGQMFNLSMQFPKNKKQYNSNRKISEEQFFAQSEISVKSFIEESFKKCFELLQRLWKEGLSLLKKNRELCYKQKAEISNNFKEDFESIESLEKFNLTRSISKNNIEEVQSIFY